MYHADTDKGKCDLHGGRRHLFVDWEGQNQPEIELNDATVASCRIKSWLTNHAEGRGLDHRAPAAASTNSCAHLVLVKVMR
jgi:hypothetical protein